MLSILGLFLGLGLLAFLIMRGYHIIIIAILCSAIVAITGQLNLYNAITDTYMAGFVSFFKSYFPVFLVGTIFGKFMEETGAAASIAHLIVSKLGKDKAVLAVTLACGILAYGGVSVFVVGFTVYPIALMLFKEANLPRRFIPGTIIFGSITFAMTCPGTPQIHNIIPIKFLNTTPMAGTTVGFITAAIMLVVGQIWLEKMIKTAVNNGEHFISRNSDNIKSNGDKGLPPGFLSLLPLISSIIFLNVFNFKVEVAVLCGNIIGLIILNKYVEWEKLSDDFGKASVSAVNAIANTCAVVGFGSVVKAVPAFTILVDAIVKIPGPPLVGAAIGVCLVAGITGSASGGMGIAVPLLSPIFLAKGVAPDALHRILAIAAGGLDSLPHNGYVVTTLNGICGESHKDGYGPVFWLTVVLPIIATGFAILLFTLFPNLP
ncbi:GntP family permease [uncultured Clostridium sp.]|uniref:GntP family permease n=1 Tax=uncultured Clostridium sp. TaxID=59620 RepID=UPI0028EE2837|nr:GntP family permease [uncultured Clostridium sp.]